MRIALDAMGGDHAPEAIVEGCLRAAREWPETELILLGTEESVQPLLGGNPPPNLRLQPVEEWIEAEEEPVRAIRRKKGSSIVVGCRMVKEGRTDAFISAGNTGALMAAGTMVTGRLLGIDRPALAPVFPTLDGKGMLVLDVGANPEARPEHLKQYALMGSLYAEKVLGFEAPRVGLLNIGTEAGKGTQLTKEAFELIGALPLRFVGNVEARDILDGVCDVLVCDGFTGNVLLKNTEGVAKGIFGRLKEELTRNLFTKMAAAVLKRGLKRFAAEMDYKEHGGAPLLGLVGPVVKAHGSSDSRAVYNAVRQTQRFVKRDVTRSISEELQRLERG
ncbi:phosphate:acyl-[acyl carrier protein] acyltransferase [Melghirimyces profundicolus]|uniref:Phosphate acyltransferase n=1 Tax=Melghirimyces profundicolus TaxID=1242148 RepID=A0A2T6BYW2_9BACL|nr:phosphate acyltransferase PlsX [Melghirimyces profundicolus]PTX61250.1 phosphate:acyl-[acyl carrier protein] acyltransferase [Melghirimyces profundicolus]